MFFPDVYSTGMMEQGLVSIKVTCGSMINGGDVIVRCRHGIVSVVFGGGVKIGGCHATFKGDKEKL